VYNSLEPGTIASLVEREAFPFHRFALFHALPPGCLSAARSRSPSPMLRTGEENYRDTGKMLAMVSALERRGMSFTISRAALWPGMPLTPPPGCVPAPHMYSPGTGLR